MRSSRFAFTIVSLASLGAVASAQTPRKPAGTINVTGTWNTNIAGGPDLLLHQEGGVVWGKNHMQNPAARGVWSEGRLILLYRDYFLADGSSCSPPIVLVMRSKGTATRLDGYEFMPDGQTPEKVFQRASPDPGPEFEWPYTAELKACGSVPTYELTFAVNGDALLGTDWQILKAVGDAMAREGSLKIRILGHTDSTGDPEKNLALSQRRAEFVKKVLVEKYGVAAERIATKGMGDEQPIAPNTTEDGRALNRRVEILAQR